MSRSPWLLAAGILLVALVPCASVALRGDAPNRLIGFEMAAVVTTLFLVAFGQGIHRSILDDLPLALALLAFGGTIVFARFLERWL